VEVLHGNEPDPGRARRRQDRQLSDDRSLDWSERETDLQLYPHSPLALADVLGNEHGCFDLLAEAADADEVPTDTPIANCLIAASEHWWVTH